MKRRYQITVEFAFGPQSETEERDAAIPSTAARHLQINMRGILLAFVWTAFWGCGWASGEWLTQGPPNPFSLLAFIMLLTVPPAAAIGALVQRQLFSLACGMASSISLATWIILHD